MRSLEQALIHYDWCPNKRKFGHRHTQKESPCEDTGRTRPSASRGERPQEKPTLPTPQS